MVSVSGINEENLNEFNMMYEELPELWNKQNHNYMNKYTQQTALQKLLPLYEKIKADPVIPQK